MPLAQAPIRSRRPAAHAQATPPASGPTDPGQDSNIASVDGGSHPSERRRPHPHLTVDGMPHEPPFWSGGANPERTAHERPSPLTRRSRSSQVRAHGTAQRSTSEHPASAFGTKRPQVQHAHEHRRIRGPSLPCPDFPLLIKAAPSGRRMALCPTQPQAPARGVRPAGRSPRGDGYAKRSSTHRPVREKNTKMNPHEVRAQRVFEKINRWLGMCAVVAGSRGRRGRFGE